jgi:hypothetical protein
MFILPFIHKVVNQPTFDINIIKFFTVGGNNIWEEEKDLRIDKDILNPNDIYRKGKPIKINDTFKLYEIDLSKTNVSEFYNWEEIDINNKETFCWKTYYILTGTNNVSWLDIPDNEKLGSYKLKELINKIIETKQHTRK